MNTQLWFTRLDFLGSLQLSYVLLLDGSANVSLGHQMRCLLWWSSLTLSQAAPSTRMLVEMDVKYLCPPPKIVHVHVLSSIIHNSHKGETQVSIS